MVENSSKYQFNASKIMKAPIYFAYIYILFTVIVFLFGPIQWISDWKLIEALGVLLIFLYPIALYIGYTIGIGKSVYINQNFLNEKFKKNKIMALKILKYTIIINLIITVLNTYEYAGVTSLSQLWINTITSLTDLGASYYQKDASSRLGSILLYSTLVLDPILYITKVSSLLFFKYLKKYQKMLVVFTILIEAFRWISIGTNKGLMDILVLIFTVFSINIMNKKLNGEKKDRKTDKKKVVIMVTLAILFLCFFAMAVSSRTEGAYQQDNFDTFPYCYVPANLRSFVERFTSYLTQGYSNMIGCMQYGNWYPMWGVGNSRFLISVMTILTGMDLFDFTYQSQLSNFGVDPYVQWHSAYSWFANDVSFIGVIFVMALFGYFFSKVVKKAVLEMDILSSTLVYFCILEIINISCTNYVLAYSDMFIGFWTLTIIWIIKNYFKIRIKIK